MKLTYKLLSKRIAEQLSFIIYFHTSMLNSKANKRNSHYVSDNIASRQMVLEHSNKEQKTNTCKHCECSKTEGKADFTPTSPENTILNEGTSKQHTYLISHYFPDQNKYGETSKWWFVLAFGISSDSAISVSKCWHYATTATHANIYTDIHNRKHTVMEIHCLRTKEIAWKKQI